MLRACAVVWAFSAVMSILGMSMATGQSYPNKPIRIVTGSIGGGNDSAARLVASGISGPLGQQVVVENRATIVTAETVAKATPDGYTLLLAGDILWIGPLLRDEKSRAQQPDALRDFVPITMLASAPNLLTVHPSFPAKTAKELIALAKAKPGALNYGRSTPGGAQHLGGEMLNNMAGIKMVPIPYKGGGDIATALVANQVDLAVMPAGTVTALVKSGKLRALAVTTLQPSAMFPELPTLASTLPGFEQTGIDAMYAPAKTPAPIIKRLNQEIVRFLRTPAGMESYLNLGSEVVASSSEEHVAKIKSRIAIIGKLIKDSGIKVE